ncbi:tetratricopeptide repeat protein [Rickettsia endosymbiont of Halotydeus destructor]|uniref:tetratricopeptide repeat protein n=1 Tax=Rickettsia endosymbiont of Halotydeus destructor TaxID=2996754 RepID=UPI003BAF7975
MQELIDFIESKGFTAEADSLKNGGTTLNLNNIKFSISEVKSLADSIANHKYLQKIDLSNNQFTSDDAKILANAFRDNKNIKTLSLSKNKIGDNGLKAFADIAENSLIKNIDFSDNNISDKGFEYWLAAQKDGNLANYNFHNNKIYISDQELQKLANLLPNVNIENFAFTIGTHGKMSAQTRNLLIKNKEISEKKISLSCPLITKLSSDELDIWEEVSPPIVPKQAEEIMAKQQEIIQKTMELVAIGNDRITEGNDKGILILGKTGAGKSTLTYLLAGEELKVVEDNGAMFFKAVVPKENIVINHTQVSETKISSKLTDKNGVAIWDCPGFMDTRGTAEEIANAFYTQKLCMISKQLKFVLAITEADLKNKENILPMVKQFAEIFTDIDFLENSVSLVITKVNNKKNLVNIQKDFDRVVTQNNDNIPAKTKKMLEFLKKSIHIFREPGEETFVQTTEILDTINGSAEYGSTKYVDLFTKPNSANISISKEAKECAEGLLKVTYNNINSLVNIFTKAISDPNKCMTNIEGNEFTKLDNYNIVESLPKSSTSEKNTLFDNLPLHSSLDPFLKLDQIKSLQKILFENLSNNNNLNSAKDNFLKVLEVFAEFVINDNELKQKIQNYAYVFKQQIDINKCFSQVCGNKPVDYSHMEQALQECKGKIEEVLKREIKLLEVEEGKINAESGEPDIAYYKEAIKYLDICKDDPNCTKQKAIAYKNLGDIYDAQGDYTQAATNYTQALKMNPELSEVYGKLGAILFNNKQYLEAIECFKVVDKSIKIGNCFKELIKLNSDDPNIRIDKGDYYLSISRHDKAMGCYRDALSLSQDDTNCLAASKKIDELSKIIGAPIRGEKYHYKKFNFNVLDQFIEEIKEPIHNSPVEQNNLAHIASNDNHEVNNMGNITHFHD